MIKNGINVNARDHRGQTLAHLAATHGHSHTLQAIIRGGADVNLQDANGWTPVHSAAYHGVIEKWLNIIQLFRLQTRFSLRDWDVCSF